MLFFSRCVKRNVTFQTLLLFARDMTEWSYRVSESVWIIKKSDKPKEYVTEKRKQMLTHQNTRIHTSTHHKTLSLIIKHLPSLEATTTSHIDSMPFPYICTLTNCPGIGGSHVNRTMSPSLEDWIRSWQTGFRLLLRCGPTWTWMLFKRSPCSPRLMIVTSVDEMFNYLTLLFLEILPFLENLFIPKVTVIHDPLNNLCLLVPSLFDML